MHPHILHISTLKKSLDREFKIKNPKFENAYVQKVQVFTETHSKFTTIGWSIKIKYFTVYKIY